MYRELSGDQIRIYTNTVQIYQEWNDVDHNFRHSYKGRMNWSKVKNKQYLYRIVGDQRKSLGPKSPETERIKEDYTNQRNRLRQRRSRLADKLKEQAPINKAYKLGRVPALAARILRKLDQNDLLGSNLFVVGTHSLYAYEIAAGVHFHDDLIATGDVDLLWDVRRNLKLAMFDEPESGILGLLKKVDSTFEKTKEQYRASNDDGYLVDLIRPMQSDEVVSDVKGIGKNDIEAAAITGLQWLINAPKYSQVAIAEDGLPVMIPCVDPRVFALYKNWLSKSASNREPIKAKRDQKQSEAVKDIALKYLNLKFKSKELSALPEGLRRF